MCNEVLTMGDAVTLAAIVEWAIHNARLRWLDERGDVASGTARCIGDERGAFASGDVREAFLRITTDAGFEMFVPVRDVMARQRAGTMVRDGGR